MIKNVLVLLFVLAASVSQAQSKFDFDTSKIGFSDPDALARTFMKAIAEKDSVKALSCFPTKEVILYMLDVLGQADNAEMVRGVEEGWAQGERETKMSIRNLYYVMAKDNVDPAKLKIDKVISSEVNKYDKEDKLLFAASQIYLSYNGKSYILKFHACMKVKGKWLISGSLMYWNGTPVDGSIPQEEYEREMQDTYKEMLKQN